jgi:hypothetical protein
MTDYLTRRYGEAQIKVKGTRRQQLEAVKGHKGIILFKFPPDPKRPFTGHFDIWNGRAARSGAYFNNEVEVWLWELS